MQLLCAGHGSVGAEAAHDTGSSLPAPLCISPSPPVERCPCGLARIHRIPPPACGEDTHTSLWGLAPSFAGLAVERFGFLAIMLTPEPTVAVRSSEYGSKGSW